MKKSTLICITYDLSCFTAGCGIRELETTGPLSLVHRISAPHRESDTWFRKCYYHSGHLQNNYPNGCYFLGIDCFPRAAPGLFLLQQFLVLQSFEVQGLVPFLVGVVKHSASEG